MKIIYLKPPYNLKKDLSNRKIVLALGFFDGVHLGHQLVIKKARNIAIKKKIPLAVMTFDKHASEVLSNGDFPFKIRYLCNLSQKERILENLGVDILYVANFTREFASLSPYEFIEKFIIKLQADTVVAGFDYTFGKYGTSNLDDMKSYSEGAFNVVKVSEMKLYGEKVSSTRIRRLIKLGDVGVANILLGHNYELEGSILNAYKSKRSIVLELKNSFQSVPDEGVYKGFLNEKQDLIGCQIEIANDDKLVITNIDKSINVFKDKIIRVELISKLKSSNSKRVSRILRDIHS